MLVKLFGAAVQGIDATIVTIEVNCSRGNKILFSGSPRLCCQGEPRTYRIRSTSKRI